MRGPVAAALVALLCLRAERALTQESPPPPTSDKETAGPEFHELLPDLGKIGAQVGILGGASLNPYGVARGFQGGGYLDLPLIRVPLGKLSYELLVNLDQADSDPFTITDPLAYISNLASGASPSAALAGPPRAPYPVQQSVRTRLRLLQLSPFGFKYTVTASDHVRLRPYAAGGLDFVVVITKQIPQRSESQVFNGTSPFDDALIAGLVSQAPELTALGTPTGQGNIEIGFHAGAGVEIRIARGLSVNLDYRFTGIDGTKDRLQTFSSALGFHW